VSTLSPDAISVIVPVHDVAEYLPEFLSSLDSQRTALPTDLIFIDDGSEDSSAELIAAWISDVHPGARLIRTENRGVSAARNTGLDEAAREWILFLDPDDVVAPGYFEALLAFIGDHPDIDVAATNLLRMQEPDHRLRDNHPLRFRFAGGNRVAELADDVFVMNAASVAFPSAAVRASGARFRTGLHASEDALFVAEYLLSLGRAPMAGFVADARYGYRKRTARTSAVDRYRSDPSTYTVRFREGYAPLLEKAATSGGVPSWLQSVLLYEMQWLLPVQLDPQRYAENLDEAQRAETLAGLKACLRHVSEDRLLRYDASALPLESRLIILALTGRPLWDWALAYGTMPRAWRRTADVIAYSADPAPVFTADAPVRRLLVWRPDVFGQRALVATRLRADRRVRRVSSRKIMWPRPGESLVQTQDRHRRRMAGERALSIPGEQGEVYVRRTRPWADSVADRRALRAEMRRRGLWSKDAMIGRLFRPGREVLVEHHAEGVERSAALFASLSSFSPVRQVSPKGGAAVDGALLFGSVAHRVARARARVLVALQPTGRPSLRARLRGLRALVTEGGLSTADALAIRRFAPDLVITPVEADVAMLSAIGLPADDVLIVPANTPDTVAGAVIARLRVDERFTTRKDARLG
jgi:hypothetical protein